MIKYIELKNILSHKDTKVEFCPGLNVIKGESHQGKSAMMHGFDATLNNSFPLDVLRSWSANEKDLVSSKITFDDTTVERCKEGTVNKYIINGDALEAMKRGEVPEEVLRATRMGEVNVHRQYAPFFLMQDSPGEVARKFNTQVGLEDIHIATQTVNAIVTEARRKLKSCKTDIEEKDTGIKELAFLDSAKKKINSVQVKLDKFEEMEERKEEIEACLFNINIERTAVEGCKKFLTIEPKLEELKEKIGERKRIEDRLNNLVTITNQLKEYKNIVEEEKDWLTIEPRLEALKEKCRERTNLRFKLSEIQSAYADIDKLEKTSQMLRLTLSEQETLLSELEKQQKKEAETCPTCGAERKYWKK